MTARARRPLSGNSQNQAEADSEVPATVPGAFPTFSSAYFSQGSLGA